MRSTTVPLETLLTAEEVSPIVGKTVDALRQDRYKGRGLPYIKLGGLIRYRASDIEAYLEANTIRPGAA